MKSSRLAVVGLAIGALVLLQGCRVWQSIFPPKRGCPTNGKNIGAERILSDPKAEKAAKKAKKFRS